MTFVDTPGLVDGDMNYPFDVNQAMLWLGDLVDLIFVFFDPIGQVRISIQMHNWTFLSSFLLILGTVFENRFFFKYAYFSIVKAKRRQILVSRENVWNKTFPTDIFTTYYVVCIRLVQRIGSLASEPKSHRRRSKVSNSFSFQLCGSAIISLLMWWYQERKENLKAADLEKSFSLFSPREKKKHCVPMMT